MKIMYSKLLERFCRFINKSSRETEHRFTEKEKQLQLQSFIEALETIITNSAVKEHYPEFIADYSAIKDRALELTQATYNQADYTQLARSLQPFLHTHRDWEPPLAIDDQGKLKVPAWYPEVECLHARLVDATELLRMIGYY